ncbi:MAG: alcohol dehydrogenase catalytic domain-containing protein [Proteobacteria bacterium]|nr:alcohol dehydrogenase catalytic domain-containing protein [Pseudomonadota bacterium]
MKAALVRSGENFEIVELPLPAPGPGEVLIKVAYCGICGSDIHLLQTGLLPSDCIIGHEISGWVYACGEGVEGWEKGTPVVILPMDSCYQCRSCKAGHPQICSNGIHRSYGLGVNPGGFSEYMLAKTSMLFRIPENLDLKTAALAEPLAVAIHGVDMLGAKSGDLALVIGAGPIGIFSTYALKAKGVSDLYVSEPDRYRAGKAGAVGVKAVIDPAESMPGSIIPERSGRHPDFVLDCAGTESSISESASVVGHRGLVLVLGVMMGQAYLMPLICFAKEVRIYFSFGYTRKDYDEGLNLLMKKFVDPRVAISDVLPLQEIGKAFQMLHGPGHMKVLIDCQAG